MKTCFTSESVTCGHPDKVCDRIADAILDETLKQDDHARVACEVTAETDHVHIMGEITADAKVDYAAVARRCIRDIGYTEPNIGFDADTCDITVNLHEQSPDIAIGVVRRTEIDSGAGDQGIMFGYAVRETDVLMPLPITLANLLTRRLQQAREQGVLPYLRPDGKAQVTVDYEGDRPVRISAVIVSAQHREEANIERVRADITEKIVKQVLPASLLDEDTAVFINPTGRFVYGGPSADTGLTGRKLVADTYGGMARHGGGSFSGKDATKVDRSGAYMARYIAKNIVAAGLASRCEVQLGYAIGLADPVSIFIETFGTETASVQDIYSLALGSVDLRPEAIIRAFGLRRPIYEKLSCYGHFGENARNMPWERTDLAQSWKESGMLNGGAIKCSS